MVSFTGSTRAGIDVAKNAAPPTVKRVTQELGGKSPPNIVLDDEDFAKSVAAGGTSVMMMNSGQSCNAPPSRMLVPNSRMDEAMAIARETAGAVKVGDPDDKTAIGPVASKAQFDKIQGLIQKGIDEGATVVIGGVGRPPDGLDAGYYVKPTVFANVTNDMTIAREEIFGPVLCILGYDDLDQALEIANDTEYGLAGYVSGATWTRPGRWPAASAPGRSRSTTVSTWPRRSVATSAAATGASGGASSPSTSTWRPRRRWATHRSSRRSPESTVSDEFRWNPVRIRTFGARLPNDSPGSHTSAT